MPRNAESAGFTVHLGPSGERVVTASEPSRSTNPVAGSSQHRGSSGHTEERLQAMPTPSSDVYCKGFQRHCQPNSEPSHGGRSSTRSQSSSGAERGRKYAGRSRRISEGRQPESRTLAQLEKAQRAKARQEEDVYDDLLAKYFGDESGRSSPGDASTGPPPARSAGSSHSPPHPTPKHPGEPAQYRQHSSQSNRHQGAPRGRGGRFNRYSGQRGGRHGTSRQQDPHILVKKKEKALREAEAKLKHSEEEKQVTQLDCEQMRQIVEAAVVEKTRALEKQAEATKEVELLKMQLLYLEQMHAENGSPGHETDMDGNELFEDEHGVFFEDDDGVHYLSEDQLQALHAQS
mmetsp:Transcript_34595/g.98020  ORF Transcript_34595/g.98020 Transcript_34595/m.98020 type:complete len:346 (-) Transcript_34595:370-1407(-)